MVKFAHILLILAVVVDINAQFFDFFSAFKPPTLRPIYEPTKSHRVRTHETTERYQENGRTKTIEHTTKSIRKTTKTTKQTNKKNKIDKIIDDGRNTINYDNPRTKVYTENPFVRPGVKPAVVSGPPITNKPPRQYVPRPIAGLDQNDDVSVTPELIIGPDEDYMTSVEKQRYIEMAEKKCDQYKALSTVRVEAIPLVPSPRPVVVNVSSCARSVPLVVGGSVVTIQQFPHMALLGWIKVQSGGYSWKCGGSLVSERHVLTAAHCAYQERDDSVSIGPPRAVQLGSSRLDDPGAIVQRVSSVTRHPKYRPPQSYNDIAIVTMTSAVTFSPAIRPACMGSPPAPGDHFIATGWGKTEFGGEQSSQLRGVSLSVWSREECSAALGTTRKLPRGPDRSQTCAGERDGGRDTCQGDSGGPAQVLSQCSWRVLAVTSAGRACGAPGTPALYANVPLAFVAEVIFGRLDRDERQHSYNQNSNSNSGQNDYKQPNSNNRENNNNQPNSSNRENNYNQQNNNNRENNYNQPNSNNRENRYNQPNSNNRENNYNQQNSNNRENNYNQPNSNNRENNYNQQNNNNRENNYNQPNSNNRENRYNQPNSNNRENNYSQQNSNNQENNYNQPNSNNRENNYNQQNNNNRENNYNQPNSNNRENNYNQPSSNNRENNYNQQNSNNRENNYNQPSSNNRENNYNQPNSNNRENKYNQPNSNNRENNYNQPNSNNRENDYNRRNSYSNNNQNSNSNSQQSSYNNPNSDSNNRQNSYNNPNSNSNNRQNSYNNQNSNSNNQQNQWNKRTTTTQKPWTRNQSYDRQSNYNPTYIDDTDGRYRTDEYSTYRPQYYYPDLPYSDGNIWRT